jgi:hypothetical protein
VSTITFSISFHTLCIEAPFAHSFPRPFFPGALFPFPPPPGEASCLFWRPQASLQLPNACRLCTCIGSSLLPRAVLTLDTCSPCSHSSHVLCRLFLSRNHSLSISASLLSQPHIVGSRLVFPWSASPYSPSLIPLHPALAHTKVGLMAPLPSSTCPHLCCFHLSAI